MVQKRNSLELEIVEVLLRQNMHLRGIAKAIGEPHPTIFRKLKNLESSNIVDSSVEGRNKVFFLKENLMTRNYKVQAEINKLNKLLEKYPELRIILSDVLKKTSGRQVLIFGSYAKSRAKKDSDIDIYVETEDKNLKKTVEEIHSKINVKIGPFDKKSDLIKEIIKDHIILGGFEKFYDRN